LLISTLRERNLPSVEQVLVERTHQALEGAEDLLTDLLDISRLDQAAVKPDVACIAWMSCLRRWSRIPVGGPGRRAQPARTSAITRSAPTCAW
jgi:signal transduction histidine kinase